MNSFTRYALNCPYRFTCNCYVALAVKHYKDRVALLQAGQHTLESHARSKGILTPKQRGAVVRAVRAAPMVVGAQVLSNLQNHSPGKHVPFDQRSRAAVNRLVPRTRGDIMSARVPGIKLDGSEGSMNQLAESLPVSLVKFIERHNNPTDPFHMSEHQVVSVGHQYSNGVSFLCLTTPQHGSRRQLRLPDSRGIPMRELDWFHQVEIEDGTTITELIQQYSMTGHAISIARTGIPAITMPTYNYLKSLKEVVSYVKAEAEVNRARSNYKLLINKPDDYKVMFPMNSPEDTLNLMDSFNYIKPLHKKSGQMVWLCSCADARRSLTLQV